MKGKMPHSDRDRPLVPISLQCVCGADVNAMVKPKADNKVRVCCGTCGEFYMVELKRKM